MHSLCRYSLLMVLLNSLSLQTGGSLLGANGRTVMQSHTFVGSSVRALMTGTDVLNSLPLWFNSIKKLGDEMKVIFCHLELEKVCNGLIKTQGQGLTWGALVSRKGIHKDDSVRENTISYLRKNLEQVEVLPYFVPVGGFMVSPVIDHIDVGTLYDIAEKMEEALLLTIREVSWLQPDMPKLEVENRVTLQLDKEFFASEVKKQCLYQLHFSRTCKSCGDFVHPSVRRRFSTGLIELQSLSFSE